MVKVSNFFNNGVISKNVKIYNNIYKYNLFYINFAKTIILVLIFLKR